MAGLANRLKKLQVMTSEPRPDFSHMSIQELEECQIDFGSKHLGDSFLHVWTSDQPWVMWLIQHYGNSKKSSHQKFLQFAEMKIERAELEGAAIPISEPLTDKDLSWTSKGYGKSSIPKAKAKSHAMGATVMPTLPHDVIEELEDESFEVLPLETEKDAEIQCLQARMLNIENALQQVIQHLGSRQEKAEP